MSLVPKPFHELLKMHFIIPPYQRGYRWESRQVEELLDDLLDFVKSLKSKRNRNNEGREPYYCLQPIAVVSHPKNVDLILLSTASNVLQRYISFCIICRRTVIMNTPYMSSLSPAGISRMNIWPNLNLWRMIRSILTT